MKRRDWRLTPEQKEDARQAFEMAKESGMTLTELVKLALNIKGEAPTKITAREAVKSFIRFKGMEGLRGPSVDYYDVNLNVFADDFGANRDIKELTRRNIGDFVKTQSRLRAVRAMLNHGLRQSPPWITSSPLDNYKLPIKRSSQSKRAQIGYLDLAEVKSIFANPGGKKTKAWIGKIPGLALGFFAMIRPEEIHSDGKPPLEWTQVNFDNRTIFIDGDQAKVTGKSRLLEDLPANLWTWLEAYKPEVIKKGQLICEYHSNQLRRHCQSLLGYGKDGKKWPHDAIRDTAITNHIVAFQNPGKTALLAGHEGNTTMIFNHYFAVGLLKFLALEYFNIVAECKK